MNLDPPKENRKPQEERKKTGRKPKEGKGKAKEGRSIPKMTEEELQIAKLAETDPDS